jgi:hypothetical protein
MLGGLGNAVAVIDHGHAQMPGILDDGDHDVLGLAMPCRIEHRLPDDIVDMGGLVIVDRLFRAVERQGAFDIEETLDFDDQLLDRGLQTLFDDMHRI